MSRPSPYQVSAVISITLTGAIFGFFYAWVCSTMWGLDAADPRTAIGAMQAMNASVRNGVFFPAFFLTPVALGITAVLAGREQRRASALLTGSAALLYLVGGILLTRCVNIPMNQQLATQVIPTDVASARQIWQDYSGRWQVWNQVRTVVSGLSLALAATAMLLTGSHVAPRQTSTPAAHREPVVV